MIVCSNSRPYLCNVKQRVGCTLLNYRLLFEPHLYLILCVNLYKENVPGYKKKSITIKFNSIKYLEALMLHGYVIFEMF